jgi:tetratricopeptide (TPR) repeat protein
MTDRLLVDLDPSGRASVSVWLDGEFSASAVGKPRPLKWPLDADALEELRWYLEDYLRAPFGVYESRGPETERRLVPWGEAVFGALFGSGPARDAYQQIRARRSGLQMIFRSASADLLGLPWELMRDPSRGQPLALEAAGIDRSLPTGDLGASFEVPGGRLRVLMVISRPSGAADVGFRMVARPLLHRLTAVRGNVDLVVLRPPTLDALVTALAEAEADGRPFQVVHFDGHGVLAGRHAAGAGSPAMYQGSGPEGVLVFQRDDGSADHVPASRVGQVLVAGRVPVVVLNACQSGAVGKELEAAVATRLLHGGAASVVAMAYSVYAVAAAEFMTAFYERLFAGDTVSQAVTAGRQQLSLHGLRPSPKGDLPLADWLIPVHYLRREVSFPGLVTVRPAEEPSLERALEKLRDPASGEPEGGGELAPVGVFTGRDALFYELETAARLQRVVILHGPAGTGKTELAKAFGRWWQDTGGVERPDWVFWHSFEPGLASFGLDGVITDIGLKVFGADFARLDETERREVVTGFLTERRALLIWDNFESVLTLPDRSAPPLDEADGQQLATFLHQLAASGRSAVLITSRAEEAWLDEMAPGEKGSGSSLPLRRITVPGLRPVEAAEYATELLAPYPTAASRRQDRAFGELMRWLDGHPLSMRLVLPYLASNEPQALLDGLAGLAPLPGWDTAQPGRTTSLSASLKYSFSHLDSGVQQMLTAICLFQAVADRDVLGVFSGADSVPAQFKGMRREEWTAALDAAASVGLLTRLGGGMYLIHPALPAYLAAFWRAGDPAKYEDQRATATNCLLGAYAVLSAWLSQQIGTGDAGFALTVIELQQRTISQLLGYALDHQHWDEATVIARPLDEFWEVRGRYAEADAWTDRVRIAVEDANGLPPGLDTPAGRLWLLFTASQANRARRSGHLDIAEKSYLHIQAILRALPTPTMQSDLAMVLHHLGMVAADRGRLEEAEDWYAQSLTVSKDLGNRAGMASTYHQLGRIAEERKQLEEAAHWYTRSLNLDEELGNRPGMADAHHQLGTVAQRQGRLEEAEDWYTRSVAIHEELGNRPGMATAYHQLGMVAEDRGRLEEAEEWYTRSLAIEEGLGNRPGIASSYGQLGLLAEDRGNVSGALEWMVRCVTVFEEFPHPMTSPGPEHLARLTGELGLAALEACWLRVTGGPLPGAVRDYVIAWRPDDEED